MSDGASVKREPNETPLDCRCSCEPAYRDERRFFRNRCADRPRRGRTHVEAGARRLHIVDLDGAFAGKPENAGVIHDIASAYPDLKIQLGGGIRDENTIAAYLDAGVNYLIVGTQAVKEPHFVAEVCAEFPTHIIVGLDAKNGKSTMISKKAINQILTNQV